MGNNAVAGQPMLPHAASFSIINIEKISLNSNNKGYLFGNFRQPKICRYPLLINFFTVIYRDKTKTKN